MKKIKILLLIFFTVLFDISITKAQDINVHNMIGKKQSDVIKKYGNPTHKDDSNPAMLCMFYSTKLNTMIFVSTKEGVYQSEATEIYNTKNDALKDLDTCIVRSIANGFTIDSVTTSDFRLQKQGVKADLQLSENKLSQKFEIKMKARKTEF